MKHLIYLHGFNSSPASVKAQQAVQYFQAYPDFRLSVPALPPEPKRAMEEVIAFIDRHGCDGLIGSSLGGYYSLYLHHRFGWPATLINPAIEPYRLLESYIGLNENLYTGEVYEVKAEHMAQLLALDVPAEQLQTERLFLLLESEDEVLDYRLAAQKLESSKMWLTRGGDHSYTGFESQLPAIRLFFERNSAKS